MKIGKLFGGKDNKDKNTLTKSVINKKFSVGKIVKSFLLHALIPFILIVIAAALVEGIIEAVAEAVGEAIGSLSNMVQVTVDENDGRIQIPPNEIETILNSIYETGVDPESLGLLGEINLSDRGDEKKYNEALKKYIRKFYEAQVATETLNYKHLESSDSATYGTVYVYRATGDSANEERRNLTYIPYEQMENYIADNNIAALDYFTVNDNDELVVAGATQTIVEKGTSESSLSQVGDPDIKISKRSINYKNAISQYTTQMMFLFDLLLVSQNPEFVSAVADLIIDSRIEITVMDNTKTNVKTETYTYHDHHYSAVNRDSRPAETDSSYNYDKITKITRTTTTEKSPSVKINYVKTWFCEQSVSYIGKTEGPVEISNKTTSEPNEKKPEGYGSWKTNQKTTVVETSTTLTYEESVREDVKFIIGESGDGERFANGEINEPTFVGLMETPLKQPNSDIYSKAGTNLVSGADTLFELLKKDQKLQNMELFMRYALNKYSDSTRYGEIDLNGSIFEIREFTSTGLSVDNALAEILRSYENNALREYMNGSSSDYNSVSNYVNQDKTQYRLYYTSADGCLNFSYGIMVRYSDGTLNNASYFADEGIDLQSLINQYNSGQDVYVDVEIIDRIFLNILNDKRNALKETLAKHGVTMKSHQIDALVSVSYQYGNCGQYISGSDNIAELYKTYYQTGAVDEFKNRAQAQTDDGGRANFFIGSLYSTRKEYTWILFNEGRYILSDGTEIRSGSEVVEFALQFVGEGHSRFTSYNPNNGVADIWRPDEWCAMFVSYCFNECGLIPDVLPRPYASCGLIYDLYNQGNSRVKIVGNKGVFAGVTKDNYTPSPGDIIFFNWGNDRIASHTGIVINCDGTKVYTVEGNTGSGSSYSNRVVSQNEYNLNSSVIVGYISIQE